MPLLVTRMNNEVSGFILERTAAGSSGSMLEMNSALRIGEIPSAIHQFKSPWYTALGPSPEPPIPIWTTVSKTLPVLLFTFPDLTLSAKAKKASFSRAYNVSGFSERHR